MRINHILSIKLLVVLFVTAFATSVWAQATGSVHTVRAGETLYAISKMYGLSVDDLRQANTNLSENIKVGEQVVVPTGGNENIFYTIQPKETLYSIARKYDIDKQLIINANPGLSETNFQAGTTIKIPVSRLHVTKVDTTVVGAKAAGIAGTNCREMHITEKGETLEEIAKKYGVTLAELQAANPDIKKESDKKLKKGTYVCIPFAAPKVTEPAPAVTARTSAEAMLVKKSNYKIVLLMPFYTDGERSTDFYRGLLYAANEMRKSGKSFEFEAYNAGQSVTDINKILAKESLANADIIVSSGSEAVSNAIADYCKQHKIMMLLPFSVAFDAVFSNPYVALANMPKSYENALCTKYFMASLHGNANVVYFESARQSDLARNILAKLNEQKKSYTTIGANSSDADFLKAFKSGVPNVIMLSSPSKADYVALQTMLERNASALAATDFSIFGYEAWKDFDTATRNTFYKYGVTILTQQFINVFDPAYSTSRQFYINTFKKTPSTNAQRAFFSGIDCANDLFGGTAKIISKPLSYKRVNTWGGLLNNTIRVVKFTKNNTTVINDYE